MVTRSGITVAITATSLQVRCCEQVRAESLAAIFWIDGDGANFGEIGAVTFERKTTDHTAIFFLNDKVANISANFFRGAGKQQALRGVVRDERVNRRGV
jgi:hypothetical protein